jgi:hypothetical protein
MGEFDDAVSGQVSRLMAAMKAHRDSIPPLIKVIPYTDPAFGYLVKIGVDSKAANDVVQAVDQTVVGLSIASQRASSYVTAASPLLAAIDVHALDVTATDRPYIESLFAEVMRLFKLLADNVDLSIFLLTGGNGTAGVVAGPLRLPGPGDTANPGRFLDYLDSQVAAAKLLSSNGTLPDEKFLDDLTRAWQTAVGGTFPNDKRSREQQVAASCVFQDRLDDTIGIINEVVGDRDLLNPAIL